MKIGKVLLSLTMSLVLLTTSLVGCAPSEEGGGSTDGTASGGNTGDSSTSVPAELVNNPAANAGNVFRFVGGSPSGIFNGVTRTTVYDANIVDMVFDKMLKYNAETLEIIASFAKDWTLDEANNSITFNLTEGAQFHDGIGEVTAEDVAFSLRMIGDPNYDGPFFTSFETIIGMKDFQSGAADIIEGIVLYGPTPENPLPVTYDESEDNKYKITLKYDAFGATNMHAFTSLYILPRAYYEKDTYEEFKALNLDPVGSGPMIYKEYVIDQYVELDKNPDYWDGAPKLDKVIYQVVNDDAKIAMLQSGSADLCEVRNVDEDLALVEPLEFVDITKNDGSTFAFMRFRLDHPLAQDKSIREAMGYGFNRAGFVESYTGGRSQLIFAPVARASSAYPTEGLEEYQYDPDKASQLLEDAGWIMGDDGYRYKDGEKLVLTYTGIAENKNDATKTAAMIQEYKAIGIEFNVAFYDWATYLDIARDPEEDVFMYGYAISMSPDPLSAGEYFLTGNYSNDGQYSNSEYDRLIAEANATLDQEEANELYKEAFTVLNGDVPILFLNDYQTPWVSNKRVENLTIAPFIYWTQDIHKVEIIQ